MVATIKYKWFASIFLALILLTLTQMGGGWSTEYHAIAYPNTAPYIDYIVPSVVRVGSPDKMMIITGNHFENLATTWVRLKGNGYDTLLMPLVVLSEGIAVVIPDTYLVSPAIYSITVVICDMKPVPTIPPPYCDEESNPVTLSAVEFIDIFFPIISK